MLTTHEVGDFGGINKDTGEFEKEGNLYRDSSIAAITARYPPIHLTEVTDHQYHSLNTKTKKLKPEFDPNVFGMSQPVIGGQWQFSCHRGAILLMYGSRSTRVPEELLEELKYCRYSEWVKGKHVVTHVLTCPAYAVIAMYLSDKAEETVSIGLCEDPLDNSSFNDGCSETSGRGKQLKWVTEGASGFFQSGCSEEANFVPLYQLKVVEKREGKRRQSPDPINDEKLEFFNVEVPWEFLDEDGEELPDDLSDMDED
ncbi:uncharacterized protein FOMMEDRAFT_142519 [Fomitiporia mediterranea MF3/22]|uniref:uncharacterized protein n=1 Tax=Fomitiporia mediterranea (strain MF3/22) TaxID=694068 RepID=UPI0004407A6E|nr:uncharacterized protein FOMMEDRAFT_142519 [Fomitiporia mediterranea MF3/22]EJD00042.1 hypothetical protein FOMMEDRAFT_142519 [Fomitiporia mediterranea MF3/22]